MQRGGLKSRDQGKHRAQREEQLAAGGGDAVRCPWCMVRCEKRLKQKAQIRRQTPLEVGGALRMRLEAEGGFEILDWRLEI
jgi:hypothetical protein